MKKNQPAGRLSPAKKGGRLARLVKTRPQSRLKRGGLLAAAALLLLAAVLVVWQVLTPAPVVLPEVTRDYNQAILGSATATEAQALAWARSNKASQTFRSWISLYWQLGESYGVNPVLAYAQAGLETNFGHFGGVLDVSYYNPCGLKTAAGGDDDDAAAHQRFASWEDGIRAQFEHLALYAGQTGFPLANPVDPRHYAYLAGSARTVGLVAETWASDPDYAEKWTYLIDRLEVTPG
ncbi:MAG: glucosaminidase domain-containing protein [Oscillospiraceae bacterium]|nr:glucosaminidase domain-containing protein [Oscillospiraceae bacterium]MDD4367411.1 glucosaminidase domain-containing protein [Oscillospiraceae bacterium]